MSNKFIYKKQISSTGTNPSLYKDSNAIYALVTNSSEGSVWIDLYMSYDDGETWLLEPYLPPDILKLYDAKIVTIGENRYVFAHGLNKYNIDTIRYIKYELYGDSEDVYAWDDEWQDLFTDYLLNARITDILVDKSQTYIHIAYDKATANGKYGVYYAVYSPVMHKIVYNTAIHSNPKQNQHNAKIIQASDNTFMFFWEEDNAFKKEQIVYISFDSSNNTFYNAIELSVPTKECAYKNHYHHTVAIDSYSNIHISWLETSDSYDTSKIQYMYISRGVLSDIQTLSDSNENNKYPFIMCDENDNLYILYNYTSSNEGDALQANSYLDLNIRYLVKKYNSSKWETISDLTDNNWNILSGWCYDKNIYSLIIEDNELYFLRIDTNIAEVFAPVSDFAITSITNDNISFSWTHARNAEAIILQRLDEDKYIDATLVEPLSVGNTWAKAVDLEPGIYKFRVKYITTNGIENVQYIDQTYYITENEFRVSWKGIDDIVSQTLQYTKETWSDVYAIKPAADDVIYYYASSVTRYRLKITGGVADGFSNEVSPLKIDFDNKNLKLTWKGIQNIEALAVQESIDGINWYKATPKEIIDTSSELCTIEHLNDVIYYYRLIYLNKSNSLLKSNSVTIVNNLKLISTTYNSVTLHWNDVLSYEAKYFQHSLDHGITWENTSYPINDNMTTIPSLKHNTEYFFRIYFPNRFTGNYSNVVVVTTNKKPINDLELVSQTKTSAVLTFTIDEDYTDVKIYAYNSTNSIELMLSETEHEKEEIIVNETFVGYKITFVISNLQKGDYYAVTVEPLGCNRGDQSNKINIFTEGDGIASLTASDITPHSVRLNFGELDRLSSDIIHDNVFVYYSTDDSLFFSKEVTTEESYVLDGLMQNTKYYIYLECTYGNNAGLSPKIDIVTESEDFEPVHGQRIPGERCFCHANDSFYVFDKGILYRVTSTTQEIVFDYNIKANHVYGAIDSDKNGFIHLVFSYGKNIYYATNCLLSDGTYSDIREPVLISSNIYVNEMMFPDIKVTYDNIAVIVYEENYSYYANIMHCAYRNKKIYTNIVKLLADETINTCPRIALKNSHSSNKGMNGFYVVVLDNKNVLKLLNLLADNDKESETYKNQIVSTQMFELNDNLVGTYNEIDIESDNLDKPHMCYRSYNNDSKSMTYAVIEDDEISQVAFNKCQYAKIITRESLIAIIEQNNYLYSSKYSASQEMFTDRMLLNDKELDIENFVNTIRDEENIYVLSFDSGKFLIQTFVIADIEASNNYINNNWIANEFGIDDNDCEISIWTDGNINNYPIMYVKINNLISDITPRNEFGDASEQTIIVDSFEIDENNPYHYIITYNNDKTLVVNANDRLMYDWDASVIVNEK